MADYHVVPRADGRWGARRAGATRASSLHDSQDDARHAAHGYAVRSGGGEVRVQTRRDARIRRSNTADATRASG